MGKRSYYCDYSLFACFLCNSQCFNFFEIKLDKLCEIVYNYVCHSQSCPSGRRSMIGNHVYGFPVPRVQIPHSAPLRSSDSRFGIATFVLLQRDLNPMRCFAVATTTEWRAKLAYRLRLQGALNFVKTKFKSFTLRH